MPDLMLRNPTLRQRPAVVFKKDSPNEEGGNGFFIDENGVKQSAGLNDSGGSSNGVEGVPGAFGGGSEGISALPFNNLSNFPIFNPVTAQTVDFPTIQTAPYKFTDPQAFAQQFGDFNRLQVKQNFGQGQDFALSALNTELQGLEHFAPAASALARSEISKDVLFNQRNRTNQVRSALPGVEEDLNAQRGRANDYASGRLPDSLLDRSLELGVRSRAADQSAFGGFGEKSAQASKVSDLMSAEERLKISQFGEGLLGSNIATRANLFLAPTEYSQAGSQIRATPEVGAGRLAYQGADILNQSTLISPATALSSEIQQNQFGTQLEQRTNEFNAQGEFGASTFNAQTDLQAQEFNSQGEFTAGLGLFGAQNAYLSQLQAGNQGNLNFAAGMNFSGLQAETAQTNAQNVQGAQTIQSAVQGTGLIPQAVSTIQGVLQNLGLTSTPETVQGGGATSGGGTSSSVPEPTPSSQIQTSLSDTAPWTTTQVPATSTKALSVDSSSPGSYKFAEGTSVPQGYTPISRNGDGTYTAARESDYDAELDRFASSNNVPRGAVTVQNAAIADKNLSTSTQTSYLPIPGFRPMGLSSTGRSLYTSSQAASSGDYGAGRQTLTSLASVLTRLGVSGGELTPAISNLAEKVSDPEILQKLDTLHAEEGPEAVSAAILNNIVGKNPGLDTSDGQQLSFMAHRMGEMWGQLSPYQKSMALASTAGSALNVLSGRNLSNEIVPGSEKSIVGKLKVGDATSLLSQGLNGFALSRNWNQLSAFGNIAAKLNGVKDIATVSHRSGMLGHGPQGASVPVNVKQLRNVGARPAPEFGVGAAVFKEGHHVPSSYKQITKTPEGHIIAQPKNLVATSILSTGAPAPLTFQRARIIAGGEHPAQKAWNQKSPSGRVIRGAAGGSAIVSGMNMMEKANPALLGSLHAYSIYHNTLNGKKS